MTWQQKDTTWTYGQLRLHKQSGNELAWSIGVTSLPPWLWSEQPAHKVAPIQQSNAFSSGSVKQELRYLCLANTPLPTQQAQEHAQKAYEFLKQNLNGNLFATRKQAYQAAQAFRHQLFMTEQAIKPVSAKLHSVIWKSHDGCIAEKNLHIKQWSVGIDADMMEAIDPDYHIMAKLLQWCQANGQGFGLWPLGELAGTACMFRSRAQLYKQFQQALQAMQAS